MQRILLTTVCATVLAGCQPSDVAQEKTENLAVDVRAAEMSPRYDALLSGAVESGAHIGVSALVFDEGRTVYTGAFGLADRERGVPVDMDTVFRIYSMTKPITSAVIMQLQDEGKLDINDPASRYIPELAKMQVISKNKNGQPVFTPQTTPMTVKDLLLHRAGMGYGIFGDANPVEALYGNAGLFKPDEDLSVKMSTLSKLPLIAQPGEGWYYSYSLDVLGRIIEIVDGKSLGESFEARIFTPLGMSETDFTVRPDQKPRFATNYFLKNDGTYATEDDGQTSEFLNAENTYQSGGGGLVGTIGDYAKFAQMMLDAGEFAGQRILKAATVREMMRNQLDADDKFLMPFMNRSGGDFGFGYGGSVEINPVSPEKTALGRFPGHWGWGGAARTHFWIDHENDAFGIIMLQYFGGEDPDLHAQFRALALKHTRDDDEG